MTRARLVCVMGVAGCGKSTVGAGLAVALGARFMEADVYHPPSNIEKMTAGIPLTDEDRWPWLDALGAAAPREGVCVIACSALRRVYRERLKEAAGEPVLFIHLAGEQASIAARMSGRRGHFMPATLLDSQFATLEPPQPDEWRLSLDISQPPEILIKIALKELT